MNPLLIKPKCTEPYYTRTVLPIEECRHADIHRADGPHLIDSTEPYSRTVPRALLIYTGQMPLPPLLSPSVEECRLLIEECRHADICRADGPPC